MCPKQAPYVGANLKELRGHIAGQHKLTMCDLCVDNRKVFTREHQIFNKNELRYHERHGDRNGGPFKGHPLCELCNQRLYDNNALWSHLRQSHFSCHLCERLRDITNEFYSTYEDLEFHFRSAARGSRRPLARPFPPAVEASSAAALLAGGRPGILRSNSLVYFPSPASYDPTPFALPQHQNPHAAAAL